MRKGTVFRLKGYGLINLLSKNGLLLLILLGLIAGMVFGIFAEGRIDFLSYYAQNRLERYLLVRTDRPFLRIMLDSFMASSLSFLVIFTAGTSLLGAILVPIAEVTKGILIGAFTAFLYSEYSVKGIAFNAVLVLPPLFIFIIAYLLAARESFRFSVVMAKLTLADASAFDLSIDFRNYCGRYVVLLGAVLLSAVLDAVLSLLLLARFAL